MLKRNLSIFFIVLFMATIIAPSITLMFDNTVDVSISLNSPEEEGKEKNLELEVFVIENVSGSEDLFSSKGEDNLGYYFKKYPKPHLNLKSPPPEFIS